MRGSIFNADNGEGEGNGLIDSKCSHRLVVELGEHVWQTIRSRRVQGNNVWPFRYVAHFAVVQRTIVEDLLELTDQAVRNHTIRVIHVRVTTKCVLGNEGTTRERLNGILKTCQLNRWAEPILPLEELELTALLVVPQIWCDCCG